MLHMQSTDIVSPHSRIMGPCSAVHLFRFLFRRSNYFPFHFDAALRTDPRTVSLSLIWRPSRPHFVCGDVFLLVRVLLSRCTVHCSSSLYRPCFFSFCSFILTIAFSVLPVRFFFLTLFVSFYNALNSHGARRILLEGRFPLAHFWRPIAAALSHS